jgi:Zn-dependent M32 family carboxypeptidase
MPSVISMNLFPIPEVGMSVQWFPRANNTRKEAARAATITQVGPQGRVSLTMFSKGVGPRSIKEVRHVLDPIHKRKPDTTMQNGGWDFIPGAGNDWRSYKPEITNLAKHLSLQLPEVEDPEENDLRQTVIEMFSQGSSVEQIAAALDEPRERIKPIVDELLSAQEVITDDKKTITLEDAKKMVDDAVAEALSKAAVDSKPKGTRRSRTEKAAAPVSPETENVLS